ncbi:ThuA domain-containing protein [Paraburkholderia sp. BR14374]|uniref:ThuA domain-containing protein n=1 Tax=Paraburkholderia sp. BR14374 TaxID=3237007 RepID=UPI0034CD227E
MSTTTPAWAVSGKSENKRINCVFVAAGKFHDIDFARLEILKLLAEDERIRVRVFEDYSNLEAIRAADFLVTYTCDVVPSLDQQEALRAWVEGGGRWFALHGTASILRFLSTGEVDSPKLAPHFMETLGSQFISHPPIGPYLVEVADSEDPMTQGLEPFEVSDELYLSDVHAELHVLLDTSFEGEATGFARRDWTAARHPVLYRRPLGEGSVLYFTLGHCRGHYDMQPLVEYWPEVQKCAWDVPVFYEILKRGIAWGRGDQVQQARVA